MNRCPHCDQLLVLVTWLRASHHLLVEDIKQPDLHAKLSTSAQALVLLHERLCEL